MIHEISLEYRVRLKSNLKCNNILIHWSHTLILNTAET